MLLWLAQYLDTTWLIGFPTAIFYSSTRMALSAITAFLFSIFVGPQFITQLYALKIGQQIRTEDCPLLGELHKDKQDTPTMGGLLILASMLVSLVLWMDFSNPFTWLLAFTTISLGSLGAYDDYLKLKYRNSEGLASRKKFLGQCLVGLLIASYLVIPGVSESIQELTGVVSPTAREVILTQSGEERLPLTTVEYMTRVYLPFVKAPVLVLGGLASIIIVGLIIFVISGFSNAVNLTDGLDGLATGCLLPVASSLALIAFVSNHGHIARYLNILYIEGSGEIAIYLSAVVGACLGFLWYNGHPAQVFMGDTGSLALGGVIGLSAVLLRREFLLLIIGAVFAVETLSVVLQVASYKLRNKKRIFLCAPLHHHFEYKGWPESKVVLRFWIMGLLAAIVGLVSLKLQ